MHTNAHRLGLVTLSLLLGLSTTGAFAQPPENRGKPEHAEKHQHAGPGERRTSPALSIEDSLVREIFRDQRQYLEPSRALPPGIRKNLERGKPLPPGIAKRFDPQLESRLPRYPGYDWRQVGADAVLIEAATGIVEAIISDVLR